MLFSLGSMKTLFYLNLIMSEIFVQLPALVSPYGRVRIGTFSCSLSFHLSPGWSSYLLLENRKMYNNSIGIDCNNAEICGVYRNR